MTNDLTGKVTNAFVILFFYLPPSRSLNKNIFERNTLFAR